MNNYWVGWYESGPFEYNGPWWESGVAYDCDSDRGGEVGRVMLCAAVKANSAEDAKRKILDAHDDDYGLKFRFIEAKPGRWTPFTSRFPRADWMVWQ